MTTFYKLGPNYYTRKEFNEKYEKERYKFALHSIGYTKNYFDIGSVTEITIKDKSDNKLVLSETEGIIIKDKDGWHTNLSIYSIQELYDKLKSITNEV